MNYKLYKWLLQDNNVRLVTLPFLTEEIAERCLTGLFTPDTYKFGIMRVSRDIEKYDAERRTQKMKEIRRRDDEKREADEREAEREEERNRKAREECKRGNNGYCSVMGGTRKKRKSRRKRMKVSGLNN